MNWKKTPDHPMRRDSDTMTFVARLWSSRPLWGAIIAATVAFGFNFKTPAQHFKELENTNTAQDIATQVLRVRVDSLQANIKIFQTDLKALLVAQCLDRPLRETQLMGISCPDLLKGQR